MKLISELQVRIKRGFLPHFTNELYKWKCEVRSLEILASGEELDSFFIEVVYDDMENFRSFIDKIGKHIDNFRVESVKNILEDEIYGGLLMVTGKVQIDNMMDYEMRLDGAAEFIISKIEHDEAGVGYTGISKNIALVCGIMSRDEINTKYLLTTYTTAEKEAIVIQRFSGYNAFPLVMRFDQIEDFIKTLQRVSHTYSLFRILDIEEDYDISHYEQIYNAIDLPVISRGFDEMPLYLASLLDRLMVKGKLKYEDISVGMIGIDAAAQRITRILRLLGCSRVLGYDNNETLMLSFENEGGLSTTQENIFNNADIIILFKNHFTDDDLNKLIPGQMIISLIDEEMFDFDIVNSKGLKEFIHGKKIDISAIVPGLVKGLVTSGLHHLDDRCIIKLAKDISSYSGDMMMPPVFSDIHERIPVYIKDYADSVE